MSIIKKIISILIICWLLIPQTSFALISKVSEEDGNPLLFPWGLKVPNGSLTLNADGTASLSYLSSSSGWTSTGDQSGLTGTKSGSYNLDTTGSITAGSGTYNGNVNIEVSSDDGGDDGTNIHSLSVKWSEHDYYIFDVDANPAGVSHVTFQPDQVYFKDSDGGTMIQIDLEHGEATFAMGVEFNASALFSSTFRVTSVPSFEFPPTGTTYDTATLVVNPSSATAGADLQWWGINGTAMAHLDAEGDFTANTARLNADSNQIVLDANGTYTTTLTDSTSGSSKTITFPNITGTLATTTVSGGGTGVSSFTAYSLIAGGTSTTGALQSIANQSTSNKVLLSKGTSVLPGYSTMTYLDTITTNRIPYASGSNTLGSSTAFTFDGGNLKVTRSGFVQNGEAAIITTDSSSRAVFKSGGATPNGAGFGAIFSGGDAVGVNSSGGDTFLVGGLANGSGVNGIVVVGTTNSTSHGLNGRNDLFVGSDIEVDGGVYADNGIVIQDSVDESPDKLWIGADGDLQIYFDGIDSHIYNETGILKITDAGSGINIGTATTELLGFYGVSPVDQPSAYTQTYSTSDKTIAAISMSTASATSTQVTPWGYSSQAEADAIITQLNNALSDITDLKQAVNAIIDDLQEVGLVG